MRPKYPIAFAVGALFLSEHGARVTSNHFCANIKAVQTGNFRVFATSQQ